MTASRASHNCSRAVMYSALSMHSAMGLHEIVRTTPATTEMLVTQYDIRPNCDLLLTFTGATLERHTVPSNIGYSQGSHRPIS
jgi:hypothetical protein